MAAIELKRRDAEGAAKIALATARLFEDASVPPLLTSRSADALWGALKAAPQLPRALVVNLGPRDKVEEFVPLLRRLGCTATVVDHHHLTREKIARFHAEGIRLIAYTPNDPTRITQLLGWGVDSVITDVVHLKNQIKVPPQSARPRSRRAARVAA